MIKLIVHLISLIILYFYTSLIKVWVDMKLR